MAAGLDVDCSPVTTSLPITTLTLRFSGGSLYTSSTRAELYYAVLEALFWRHLSIRMFISLLTVRLHCMPFILSLPLECDLVNKCLDFIHGLEGAGATVHFTWIPSHEAI
ncbi:hypothetical protein E2C01_050889 [Portunus trituberculatus]|uniref:Uncharacterized protein n=1 Tax=Portunus trituberculatus TaxID=210409 RepID=A0A5B7GDA7_PORTR|nr:hypothetical protein [Portunus trituberculatus]